MKNQELEKFTFHNVSINTILPSWSKLLHYLHLHSTMFLLILEPPQHIATRWKKFTFHNVSINTVNCYDTDSVRGYLHSTMFLLIHQSIVEAFGAALIFTFHNVSINTQDRRCTVWEDAVVFTFHNVSINTTKCRFQQGIQLHLHSTMFLLIPIPHNCLYYMLNLTTFCRTCHFIISGFN